MKKNKPAKKAKQMRTINIINAKNLINVFFKANSKTINTRTANKLEAARKKKMPPVIATPSSVLEQNISACP